MADLSNAHWIMEEFRQRMTVKEWKDILLNSGDIITVKGNLRQLIAKRLGYGAVEIYKKPLKRNKS